MADNPLADVLYERVKVKNTTQFYYPLQSNCLPVIISNRFLVQTLILFPHIIIGTVRIERTNARTVEITNMFTSPTPAIHGFNVVAIIVVKALRMKNTPTNASPLIC